MESRRSARVPGQRSAPRRAAAFAIARPARWRGSGPRPRLPWPRRAALIRSHGAAASSATKVRARSKRASAVSSPMRGGDARREGHDHARHAEASGQPRPVNRTGAAERDAGERSRILAPSDRHHADGPFHVERHELMDAPRGIDHAHAERLRPRAPRWPRWPRPRSSAARSAQEEVRRRDSRGRGWRRSPWARFPQAVAGGPGIGARAFRAHAQDAALDAGPAPPPAPISTRSTLGTCTGRPLPFRMPIMSDLELVSADRYARFRSGRPWRWCRPCRRR